MATISTGLHFVRKRLKSGDRWYVYAWRSGPRIYEKNGARPAITPALLDLAYAARRRGQPKNNLDSAIDLYRESAAFDKLADSTKADYRAWLTRISHRFGRVPLSRVHELRPELIAWRDELADTPRAADRAVGMVSSLCAWALDRSLITANPAEKVRKLHKVNRSDLIWELPHWLAVAPLPRHITRPIGLAGMTGLSLGDLLSLRWEDVGDQAITARRGKTGVDVTVPLYADLRTFLGERGSGPVLRTLAGKPWTVSGFKSSWQTHRPPKFNRTFHDLRGTFATVLAIHGFSDPQIAMMMGWTLDRVAAIRARYVNRERVLRELVRTMDGKSVTQPL